MAIIAASRRCLSSSSSSSSSVVFSSSSSLVCRDGSATTESRCRRPSLLRKDTLVFPRDVLAEANSFLPREDEELLLLLLLLFELDDARARKEEHDAETVEARATPTVENVALIYIYMCVIQLGESFLSVGKSGNTKSLCFFERSPLSQHNTERERERSRTREDERDRDRTIEEKRSFFF